MVIMGIEVLIIIQSYIQFNRKIKKADQYTITLLGILVSCNNGKYHCVDVEKYFKYNYETIDGNSDCRTINHHDMYKYTCI